MNIHHSPLHTKGWDFLLKSIRYNLPTNFTFFTFETGILCFEGTHLGIGDSLAVSCMNGVSTNSLSPQYQKDLQYK